MGRPQRPSPRTPGRGPLDPVSRGGYRYGGAGACRPVGSAPAGGRADCDSARGAVHRADPEGPQQGQIQQGVRCRRRSTPAAHPDFPGSRSAADLQSVSPSAGARPETRRAPGAAQSRGARRQAGSAADRASPAAADSAGRATQACSGRPHGTPANRTGAGPSPADSHRRRSHPRTGYNQPVSVAPSSRVDLETAPSGAGKALAGFLLSGFLLALLGAILPAWGYHRDPSDFLTVGNYFLCVAAGLAASFKPARYLMARRGLPFLLVFACLLACASLVYLALVSPPASALWRAAGLLVLGAAAGMLNMALFQAISWTYRADASGDVTKCGIWYGL